MTPDGMLLDAIKSRDIKAVMQAIEDGASNLDTALEEACCYDDIRLVTYLVNNGAQASERALINVAEHKLPHLLHPLYDSGVRDFNPFIKVINLRNSTIEPCSIRIIFNNSKDYVFAYAALVGDKSMLELLMAQGASNYNLALSWAAYGEQLDICIFLLERGADDVNWALISAAKSGKLDVIKYLRNHGADQLDDALLVACDNKRYDCIKYLLDEGAGNILVALKAAVSIESTALVKYCLSLDKHLDRKELLELAGTSKNRYIAKLLTEYGK